jgi:protein-S-isoprenylcysteine O-methyltransferase Ste14
MAIGIDAGSFWLPLALSLLAFGSFAWALRGHFETAGAIPTGMRLLSLVSLLSYATYAGLLFRGDRDRTAWTTLGLVAFASAIALFWWTVTTTRRHRLRLAHTDADPDIIYTGGPYALVRHPFYLSYIIFWIGTALVVGKWQWAPALILTVWYVRVAQREERRFRSSAFSTGYDTYRRRTGMLLPRLEQSRR